MAECFNIETESIKILIDDFNKNIKEKISLEFLSHMVSALEKMAREVTGTDLFVIELKPHPEKKKEFSNIFSSKYSPKRFFTIYYPEDMEPKQKRVGIAHELGHLYLLLLLEHSDIINGDEALCSIFSIITIADRCQFYKKESKKYIHSSIQSIIKDMSLLHNTKQGKYNISN